MARLMLPRTRRARLYTLAAVLALLIGSSLIWLLPSGTSTRVHTEQRFIEAPAAPDSQQDIRIDTTLYVPESATQGTPAPAVLLAHGFGGDKTSVSGRAQQLAERGFVVLAYSARGFGDSGGKIWLNHPDREVADAARLLDYLATLPQVVTDSPGDPRVGVTGASYGGALALLLAGSDNRVDVLAPVITYNDLASALLPNAATTEPPARTPAPGAFSPDGVLKQAWAGLLFATGAETFPPAGQRPASGPAGTPRPNAGAPSAKSSPDSRAPNAESAMCGRFAAPVCRAYRDVAVDGHAKASTLELLHSVSPATVTDNIDIPTLLVQGQRDTLFGLAQADANARQINAAGGKVKVVWFPGGHGSGEPSPRVHETIGDWLDYHLTGAGPAPETGFSYAIASTVREDDAPPPRRIEAPVYPGLSDGATESREIPLRGDEQVAVRPPGGVPGAISGLPALGMVGNASARLTERISVAPPGQSASFASAPLREQLLVTGASTVRLRVSDATPGEQADPQAALFAKLYDVGPNGDRTLVANAASALRVPQLPADGSPVEVAVTLPGIVHSFDQGHSLRLVVGTTDRAYLTPAEPAAFRISLAGERTLAAPTVHGQSADSAVPTGQLIGIGGVLLAVLISALVAALRRKRRDTPDAALVDTPLVIEGLTKSYPGGLRAVDNLSLRVEPGQVLGLLGPNGAGKTTALRMLLGLVRPSAGQIKVFGHRIRPGAPTLSRIGSFVEGSGFLPHLSGSDNLRLYWASTGRDTAKAHLHEALEIAGLGDAVHRKVRTYSQGMRQRLAIAQAMLGLPELLVLDEPTNGLDPPQIHQMREVLQRYAATGRTVLVSSHLLAEVEQTCSHVVVMHRGALVTSGEVTDVVAAGGQASFRVDSPEAAAEALRAAGNVSEIELDGDLVHAELDGMPRSAAVAALVRAGVSVEQAGPRRRLEDAFLQLVAEGSES